MILVAAGLVPPLLSTFTYRVAGTRWPRAIGLGATALVLAAIGGIVCAFIFGFAVDVESGLCGETPRQAVAAGIAAYVIVASWAARRPSRVWGWSLVIGSALAAVTLVAYFFTDAHHYCET